MFKKKDVTQTPQYKEQIEELNEKDKVQNLKLKTKEEETQEQPQVTIEEVALTMTEHQFKAYVISKLEEITQRLQNG
jgi:hypothetical protein